MCNIVYPGHTVYTAEWEPHMHAWHGETPPEWPSILAHSVWPHRDSETDHAKYSVPPPSPETIVYNQTMHMYWSILKYMISIKSSSIFFLLSLKEERNNK